jgi:hypothetical protein
MKFDGKEIVVAVAPGNAERRPGDLHARPFDFAVVDAIADGHIGVTAGADIANGGETRAERNARVLDAGDSFPRDGNPEALIASGGGVGGDVRVDIDQAWKTRCGRKVERRNSGWQFGCASGADRSDGAALIEDDDLIGEHVAAANVEKFSATDSARSCVSDRSDDEAGCECEKRLAHKFSVKADSS